MIKFIRWILGLCEHEYRVLEKGITHVTHDYGARYDERYYVHGCTKCGKVKKQTFVY